MVLPLVPTIFKPPPIFKSPSIDVYLYLNQGGLAWWLSNERQAQTDPEFSDLCPYGSKIWKDI